MPLAYLLTFPEIEGLGLASKTKGWLCKSSFLKTKSTPVISKPDNLAAFLAVSTSEW